MKRLAVTIIVLLTLGACASSGPPMPGLAYQSAITGVAILSDEVPEREGRACAQSVLWFVGWGDGGIEAARRAGDIQVISSVDEEVTIIVGGVYSSRCTIVRGR